MATLQLCTTQAENQNAYIFRVTNTKVFSLEEALFHAYHNWKQTADELYSTEFIDWVKSDLGLPDIAAKLKEYADFAFGDRLSHFCRIIDYFDDAELSSLTKELEAWEKRVEWEKLKDRGDYLTAHNMPDKAVNIYKRALTDGRRVSLLNNTAVALMRLERYAESAALLREALDEEPNSNELKLNYAEACIYAGKTREAMKILEELPPSASVFRVFGELYSRAGDKANALRSLKSAADLDGSAEYMYTLSDYYVKTSEYEDAIRVIDRVKKPDAETSIKRAEIYKAQRDFTSASNILEKAIAMWPNNADLWLELSECSRRNSNPELANRAVTKALTLQPENPRIKLEAVKVKRALNRPMEYREALRQLINYLKGEYRENEG